MIRLLSIVAILVMGVLIGAMATTAVVLSGLRSLAPPPPKDPPPRRVPYHPLLDEPTAPVVKRGRGGCRR